MNQAYLDALDVASFVGERVACFLCRAPSLPAYIVLLAICEKSERRLLNDFSVAVLMVIAIQNDCFMIEDSCLLPFRTRSNRQFKVCEFILINIFVLPFPYLSDGH